MAAQDRMYLAVMGIAYEVRLARARQLAWSPLAS